MHRANVAKKREDPKSEGKELNKRLARIEESDEMESFSPRSPTSKKIATIRSSALSTGIKPNLEKYAETEEDINFDDLDLDIDDSSVFNLEESEDQVMTFEIHWDEKDNFKLDVGDELRYSFEQQFKELDPSSKSGTNPIEILNQLQDVTKKNPTEVSKLILDIVTPGGTGLMILMDLLGPANNSNPDIARNVIKWINTLLREQMSKEGKIRSRTKLQERVCILGYVNVVLNFCHKSYPSLLRLEAAEFAKLLCFSNSYTRKMLCACGGLRVLIALFDWKEKVISLPNRRVSRPLLPFNFSFNSSSEPNSNSSSPSSKLKQLNLEKDLVESKILDDVQHKLICTAIDCIEEIFKIHDSPKDDFCRLFCEYGVLPRLSRSFDLLKRVKDDKYVEKVIELISVFSGGDVLVRKSMAYFWKPVLPHVMDLKDNLLEKTIKAMKMTCGLKDPTALDELENVGMIQVFLGMLRHDRREIYNQVLLCLDMLLDISPRRVEKAVIAGLIPCLIKIARKDATMIQIIKKILCSLPMSSAKVRLELKKHGVFTYYLSWLTEASWRSQALSSLSLWLKEEKRFVGQLVTQDEPIKALTSVCVGSTISLKQLSSLLPIMNSMIDYCPKLGNALSESSEFVGGLINHLQNPLKNDPIVIGIQTAATEILHSLSQQTSDIKDFEDRHQILTAFESVAQDAKKLDKVRLYRIAERCYLDTKWRLQSSLNDSLVLYEEREDDDDCDDSHAGSERESKASRQTHDTATTDEYLKNLDDEDFASG
mmetsp:Transcript_1991/g.2806  ORF Transcript_1991/g.2806 Transcript_1991/m.2806 type:complete len:768 (-) Transcript_1991:217-2520(-)